ncbi:MAG: hypothetical protein ACRCX2_14705 [Paraclostridium sp.]
MAIIIPNGDYLVYYDSLKLNLMAKISIRNEEGHGKLERYDLDGNLIYSTSLDTGKLNGLFILFKSTGAEIVQILFNKHDPEVFILSTNYTYNIGMRNLKVDGNMLVKSKSNSVFDVDLVDGSKVSITYYNQYGQVVSSNKFNSKEELHGINSHKLFRGAELVFTAENGIRINPATVKHSLFDRDLKLNFVNNEVNNVG